MAPSSKQLTQSLKLSEASRTSVVMDDYIVDRNFLQPLKDFNNINPEEITKRKIIALGNILKQNLFKSTSEVSSKHNENLLH